MRIETRIHFEDQELRLIHRALSIADRSAIRVAENDLEEIGISAFTNSSKLGTGRIFSVHCKTDVGYSSNQVNSTIRVLEAVQSAMKERMECPWRFHMGPPGASTDIKEKAQLDDKIAREAMHLLKNAQQAMMFALD